MTDTLTVSRELLRHTIDAMIGVFNGASITGMPVVKSVSALRAALEQPAPQTQEKSNERP